MYGYVGLYMGSIGFRPYNFRTRPPPIMENQMDNNVEN